MGSPSASVASAVMETVRSSVVVAGSGFSATSGAVGIPLTWSSRPHSAKSPSVSVTVLLMVWVPTLKSLWVKRMAPLLSLPSVENAPLRSLVQLTIRSVGMSSPSPMVAEKREEQPAKGGHSFQTCHLNER